ncbi:MAG: hypothetical protein Tp172MES00d2C118482111_1 [Prokaryotic dsDNA virus sp.]|nr:MAG: hypothetical protein Tp172MES00d2C118482111_1 [Prokaryotic dsDNA virus sp.]|tara:strand:- start:197 stop:820 length:624 start_codon:yes stop_codon:yes gene_type:complete
MTPKGYTTEEKVEAFGLVDIAGSFSSVIDGWIVGVENTIDQITGRNFIADATESERLFSGDGGKDLLIDDAIEITKVEVGLDDYGGNFIEIASSGASRYFTEPANHTAKGVPITKIMLRDRRFTTGVQNHRIEAKWGYSEEVPADIEFCATVFVFGIANQQRQGGQSVKSERIGNYQVTYNSENGKDSWGDFERAMQILDSYKRYHL